MTTVSDLATIYGCCGLFDLCSDNDLMSLSFEGKNAFLDWIGWEKTDVCIIKKNFITFTRPAAFEGARTAGYLSNPCGDSNGVEWGKCDFTLTDFGLLRRHGPTRNATRTSLKYCEAQPRYRLDGTPITSDAEYDMRLAMEAILQDLKRMLVDGNNTTGGQFDGLQQLVKTGYTDSNGASCPSMDSEIIDWNDNGIAGGSGITWNSRAIPATVDMVDVIIAAIRRILDKIRLAPALSAQQLSVGDVIFVAPVHVLRALLDSYTCWSVCPGSTNKAVAIQSYEARTFRNGLNGGMFGVGKIYVDGFEIPLMAYDWNMTEEDTGSSDAYILTGKIGSVRTISGQYNNLAQTPIDYPDGDYSATDGGKVLTWLEKTKTCLYREVEMQPRLLMWAPWAQVRIQDIWIDPIAGIWSADPWATSFFPVTSFDTPTCP